MNPGRTYYAIWIVVTLLVLATAPAEAQQGKRRALLVACQNYPQNQLTKLEFAYNDMKDFREALLHTGFSEDDITLLYDPEDPKPKESLLPTAANIRAQLNKLQRMGENNTLIVALSGHGVQFDDDKHNYFCPIDANVQQRATLIDLAELYEMLKKCPAQRKLLLVDACRNDPFPKGYRAAQLVNFAQLRKQDVPEGIAAIFSCSPGEKSLEDWHVKHGIFFHHLLEAWNGAAYDNDEKLTLEKLLAYTVPKTIETARKLRNIDQTPQVLADFSGAWELWKGHVGELHCYRGHEGGVDSVAFCPGGLALTGSLDNTMRLWDLKTGKQLHCFKGRPTQVTTMVHSVAVSPTGRYALAGSSDESTAIRLVDLKEGKEKEPLRGHEDAVNSVVFSPDGRFVLSGSEDRTIRLWDLKSNKEQECLRGHEGAVYGVAFSYDGQYALSGSEDTTVRLWDLRTEKQVFSGHTMAVRSVAFSPDGRRVLSGGDDKTVRLWEVETGRELHCFKQHTGAVLAVAFSPDRAGRRILSGSADGMMRMWDAETGKELLCLDGHCQSIMSVAFSPDGRRALTGGLDGTVRLWDLPRK